MNAAANTIPAIGEAYAGGINLGDFFLRRTPYTLIGASKAELAKRGFPTRARWSDSDDMVEGALSMYDGLANTDAMAAAGSKIAKQIRALRIDSRDDWYLWSAGEALLGYAADLKGVEAFKKDWYLTSSQHPDAPRWARIQSFSYGGQDFDDKGNQYGVFVVRREIIR